MINGVLRVISQLETMSCMSGCTRAPTTPRYLTPDFEPIQRELATKGVTRMLLCQEYKAKHPDGCQYSAFCRGHEV